MTDTYLDWLDSEILKSKQFALNSEQHPHMFSAGSSRMLVLSEAKAKYLNVPFDGKEVLWIFLSENRR